MSWRYWINKEGKPMTGKYYEFKNFKVYKSYKKMLSEQINKFDFEQSFTGQFLKAGFKSRTPMNPTVNWFGVSVYEPDMILEKDNKRIKLSLQGMSMPVPPKENKGAWELLKQCECKYIGMFIDNKSVYENWTGSLPNKETINNFLNASR